MLVLANSHVTPLPLCSSSKPLNLPASSQVPEPHSHLSTDYRLVPGFAAEGANTPPSPTISTDHTSRELLSPATLVHELPRMMNRLLRRQ